jgi:hypothetical protein
MWPIGWLGEAYCKATFGDIMQANVQCAAEVHIQNVGFATRGYVSVLGERDVH